jgi:hypothetical protein
MGLLAVAGVVAALTLPASGDVPSETAAFVQLSDGGPSFLAYDGTASFDAEGHDWPVSLVFSGNASVGRVKAALRRAGLTRRGSTQYLAYRVSGTTARFDGDSGLKGPCDANGTDLHVRLYAPAAADRFVDPVFGSVVIGTTHLDRADGCSKPPTMFGFSEEAERQVAAIFQKRGWRVQRNHLLLDNAEPYRRDVTDPAHVWWGDGRATVITVP